MKYKYLIPLVLIASLVMAVVPANAQDLGIEPAQSKLESSASWTSNPAGSKDVNAYDVLHWYCWYYNNKPDTQVTANSHFKFGSAGATETDGALTRTLSYRETWGADSSGISVGSGAYDFYRKHNYESTGGTHWDTAWAMTDLY